MVFSGCVMTKDTVKKTVVKKKVVKKKVVKKPAKKMGATTKYKKKYNIQAMKLCLLGATDEKLANFFDVSVTTLNTWKVEYPNFLLSIREGKEVADANVANALYNRAIGFTHKEIKVFNNQGEILTHEVDKHYPTDTGAAFICRKNLPNWTDKQ